MYIHKDFAIAAGVNVTHILLKFGKNLVRICQVAIVGEANSVWIVGVERLSLSTRGRTRRRVSYVANAARSHQVKHMLFREHVPDEPIGLAQVQHILVRGSDNARGVLPSVLQHRQSIIDQLVTVRLGIRKLDSNNPTHTD